MRLFDRVDSWADGPVARGALVGVAVTAFVVLAVLMVSSLLAADEAPVTPPPPVAPRVEFGTVVVVVDGVEVPSSCDGFGHRVYLTPESSYRERSIVVADDPSCVEAAG